MRHWAFSRGLGGILVLIDFARRHGMSLSDTLAESGITQAQLRQPNADVAATQELRVIANIVQRLGDPVRLGLDMGLSFHFATYGIWGLALISSATGRDAMQFALRSLPLTHAFTTIDYEETAHHAALVFGEPGLPADLEAFLIARDMAAASLLQREVMGPDFVLRRFTLAMSRPCEDTAALPDILGAEVELGAGCNRIVFDRVFLERPLPQANAATAAMCQTLCRHQLDRQPASPPIAGFASHYRNAAPASAPVRLTELARMTNVSERTLKRRLKAEGTSFRALSAESRRARAETLLAANRLSIGDIAAELGFSDLSSFSQAFKRWTGVAPSAYRRQALGGETSGD